MILYSEKQRVIRIAVVVAYFIAIGNLWKLMVIGTGIDVKTMPMEQVISWFLLWIAMMVFVWLTVDELIDKIDYDVYPTIKTNRDYMSMTAFVEVDIPNKQLIYSSDISCMAALLERDSSKGRHG